MSKYLKGFLIGLFGLVVVFCMGVLISGSIRGNNFVDEIKSWGDTAEEQVVEAPKDEEITDGGETTDETTETTNTGDAETLAA